MKFVYPSPTNSSCLQGFLILQSKGHASEVQQIIPKNATIVDWKKVVKDLFVCPSIRQLVRWFIKLKLKSVRMCISGAAVVVVIESRLCVC